jgi:hypothetical protein
MNIKSCGVKSSAYYGRERLRKNLKGVLGLPLKQQRDDAEATLSDL